MRFLIGTILTVSFLCSPAFSQLRDDKRIIPGERIGRWILPTTIDGLLKINGPKKALRGGPPVFALNFKDQQPAKIWVHRWDHLGLRAVTIGTPDTQEVFNLTISILFDPSLRLTQYQTDKHIGLGVPREVVEAAYGKPTAFTQPAPGVQHLIYDKLGLAVAIYADGRVGNVIVFRKGSAKQRWRF